MATYHLDLNIKLVDKENIMQQESEIRMFDSCMFMSTTDSDTLSSRDPHGLETVCLLTHRSVSGGGTWGYNTVPGGK